MVVVLVAVTPFAWGRSGGGAQGSNEYVTVRADEAPAVIERILARCSFLFFKWRLVVDTVLLQ